MRRPAAVEQGQHRDVAPGLPSARDDARRRLDQFGGVGTDSGFGTLAGSFGARNTARAGLDARPRRSRKRMKPRTTDRPRAAELRSTLPAREASQAR